MIPSSKQTWRYRIYVSARLKIKSFRCFRRKWFMKSGTAGTSPTTNHIMLINRRLQVQNRNLEKKVQFLGKLATRNITSSLDRFKEAKYKLEKRVVLVQSFWDFFFDIFSQRKTIYAPFLRRCDSVVTECYNLVFHRLGQPNPYIKTPPLCYIEKSFSFATIRRGVQKRFFPKSLVRTATPFPVIKIPYDRIANPWTLTSLIHEVSHDIHGDIPNLWKITRIKIYKTLRQKGFSQKVAWTWSFWHKETLADLLGILLGGPAIVRSFVDLVSLPDYIVMKFRPNDSHPTPYLRVLISTHTLNKLGFSQEARQMEREWKTRYPLGKGHKFPPEILNTASQVIPIVVNILLWTPYAELGGKKFVELVYYSKKMHRRVLSGSKELLAGRKPANLPKRLIISAGVYAFQRRPDKAKMIKRLLYKSLDETRFLPVVTPLAMPRAKKRKIVVINRTPKIIYRTPWIIYRKPYRRGRYWKGHRRLHRIRPRPLAWRRRKFGAKTLFRPKRIRRVRSIRGRPIRRATAVVRKIRPKSLRSIYRKPLQLSYMKKRKLA